MLVVQSGHLKAIADNAEAAYPREACGLLVGRQLPGDHRVVARVERAENVAADPRKTFEVDPGLRIGLERELRGQALAVIGHYHSHPDGPARPSAHDLEMALEPDLAWLIVAVGQGQASHLRAYLPRLDRQGFRVLPIVERTEAGRPNEQQGRQLSAKPTKAGGWR